MTVLDAPLVENALDYARRGWPVLPLWWPTETGECACGLPDCDSIGSHPVRRLVPHGLRDATDQEQVVRGWWRSFPRANLAIGTGGARGPIVLDVDGMLGELALRGLVAYYGPFEAWWVRAGSGGWHAYFANPGPSMPTSAARLGDGLSLLGGGSYVVAPPSLHATLRRWRWLTPERDTAELPAMPGWLLDLATPGEDDARRPRPVRLRPDDVPAYTAATIERETRAVAQARHWQRRRRLNRAAFTLGQLVGAGLMDEAAATDVLVGVVLAAWPAERQVRTAVRRGVHAGKQQPQRIVLHRPGRGGRPR